jgi:hypothetical protein
MYAAAGNLWMLVVGKRNLMNRHASMVQKVARAVVVNNMPTPEGRQQLAGVKMHQRSSQRGHLAI